MSFGGAAVTARVSRKTFCLQVRLASVCSLDCTVTCFLCIALAGINSELATVQEQLFLGDTLGSPSTRTLCPSPSLIPFSGYGACGSSRPGTTVTLPMGTAAFGGRGEILTGQKALELSLLQSKSLKIMSYSQYLLFAHAKVRFLLQIKF